jgi:hypothetical protein
MLVTHQTKHQIGITLQRRKSYRDRLHSTHMSARGALYMALSMIYIRHWIYVFEIFRKSYRDRLHLIYMFEIFIRH